MTSKFGLTRRDPITRRIKDRITGASYRRKGMVQQSITQPIRHIHDQRLLPSCVGHAVTAAIEQHLDSRVSAVSLWWDARRREGRQNYLDGTQLGLGVESACLRGWSPYQHGEDSDYDLALYGPKLSAELFANHTHQPKALRYRITDGDRDSVIEALQLGYGVVFGSGVTQHYVDATSRDRVLGIGYLGGSDGHAQRIYGWDSLDDVFLIQNSWGRGWGGGYGDPGCCAVLTSEVMCNAWDIYALQIA